MGRPVGHWTLERLASMPNRTLHRSPGAPPPRVHALDWLRVLCVASLFAYHALLPYAGGFGWIVGAPEASWRLTVAALAVSSWRMPLMFVVGGASLAFMLRRHSLEVVARRRVERLLLPLLAGVLFAIPPQRLLDANAVHQVRPALAAGNWLALGPITAGGVNWYHLWFLPYLLLLTGAAILAIRLIDGRPRASRVLATVVGHPWRAAVVLALLAVGAQASGSRLEPAGLWRLGLSVRDLLYWGSFFAFGLFVARRPNILETARRHRRAFAAAWAVLAVAYAATLWATYRIPASSEGATRLLDLVPTLVALRGPFRALTAVPGVLALLGYGAQHLDRATPALAYLRDAGLPGYVLHQPLIVVWTVLVAQLALPAGMRYVLVVGLTVGSFAVIYERLIRRSPLGRRLFGLPALPTALPFPTPARGAPGAEPVRPAA